MYIKIGPETLGTAGYNVTVNSSIQSSRLLNIILNGYPYKSASQLGVRDDSEAYYITQFAIWINQEGFELWRWINNGEEEYIRNALVNLYNKRDLPTQVFNVNIVANNTKSMQIDNINPNYISAEYEVVSNIDLTSLTVNIPNNNYGAIIRDVNNNVVNDFKSLKKFKVLIPIANLGGSSNILVNMNISAKTTEYNAYYGTAEASNYQDIGVAIIDPVVRNLSATATYNNTTSLDIYVKNKSGQALPNSSIKITNPSGQNIGTYTTDSSGRINLKYIVAGNYTAQILSVPSGYALDSTINRTTNVSINSTGTINFVARKYSGIVVNSIDKQGNILSNVNFKIVDKNTGNLIKQASTNIGGKLTLDNIPQGVYTITSIDTVVGYKIDKSGRDITVSYDSEYTQTTFKSYLLGSIEIIKNDIYGNALDNVKFKIMKQSDNSTIGTYTTDINGKITVSDLYSGDYIIQEIEAKPGYYNDGIIKIVAVKNEDEI
ncbi:MAG: SpaA isopeptide-forming pilin-related protein [Clostridia bacterium]|nr:SpaA isopeptide-forming pilin-related protein [Clostridia bacterium]